MFKTNDKDLIIKCEPVALFDGYITIEQRGVEIGKVRASFDFKDMPPEYHEMVGNYLMQTSRRLGV